MPVNRASETQPPASSGGPRPKRAGDRTAPPGTSVAALGDAGLAGAESPGPGCGWYLESRLPNGMTRRVPVQSLPFHIGRGEAADLRLELQSVSKRHAEIYEHGGSLRLRDLGSTNGTFVDREPVENIVLRDGQILHFSEAEWRMGFDPEEEHEYRSGQTLPLSGLVLPENFVKGTEELETLLDEQLLRVMFQPIVGLPGGAPEAYEALARGRHAELPESPVELFRIAAAIGKESELSRVCRRAAVEHLAGSRDSLVLFLNSHPREFEEPGLVESLAELRALAPQLSLVLEIHEGMLANPEGMAELRTELKRLGMGLAYDDFGTGQARLLELGEVPPDYLKFDMRFVRGIDDAPLSRRRLLASLVKIARDLRAVSIAEGVETAEEAGACTELGFSHAQGYFFSRPLDLPAVPRR